MDCFPDACQYRDNEGKFPLDHALEVTDPKASIVQLLIQQHPVLLSYQDEAGRLPLQRLLKKAGASRSMSKRSSRYDKVVKVLLEGFEGSLRLQDGDGHTPLMLACTSDNSPISLVYILLRQWPEQISPNLAPNIFNNERFNGELIHSSLASESATLDNVKLWLQRYPDTVLSKDRHGRLPLHYAVVSTSAEAYEIFHYLLMEHAAAAADDDDPTITTRQQLMTPDNDGLLPMHIAAASSTCSLDILQCLIHQYPESLLQADKDGRLPWHFGECSRQDVVFEETVQRFPAVDTDLDLVPDEIRFDFLPTTS
ncbi:MAG: hypothetical protein SGILL_009080 [Bacillariaceae sp.]